EQPVHLWSQPEQGKPFRQAGQAALRRSVDAQKTALAGIVVDRGIAAGADLAFAAGPLEAYGHGPWPRTLSGSRIAPVDIAATSLAQSAAGGEEGKGFQQVGLAGAVRTAQHHRTVIGLERSLAIAAETADGEAGDIGPARSTARQRRKGDDV